MNLRNPLWGDITRSPKQGYQWPNKKDLCPSNCFEENKGRTTNMKETLRFLNRPVWTDLRPFFTFCSHLLRSTVHCSLYLAGYIFTIELIRRIYSPRFQGFVQPWHSIEFSRNTQSWQHWHFCTIFNGNRSTLEIVDNWINFSTHWQFEFILK